LTQFRKSEVSIESFDEAVNNISITLNGTGTQSALQIELSNQGSLPISLSLLSGAIAQPEVPSVQGMAVVGFRTSASQKARTSSTPSISSEQDKFVTVPAGGTVTLPLDAVCLNFNIEGAPEVGYTDFDLPGVRQPEIVHLINARDIIEFWGTQEDRPLFSNKPTVWRVASFQGKIDLIILQFAIWAHTDRASYLDLKQIVEDQGDTLNTNVQVFADLVNLIIQTSAIEFPEELFMPEWDLDWSARVDSVDLTTVSKQFDRNVLIDFPNPDVNRDGLVDIFDLVKVGANYNKTYRYQSASVLMRHPRSHVPNLSTAISKTQISSILQGQQIGKQLAQRNASDDFFQTNSYPSTNTPATIGIRLTQKENALHTAEVRVSDVNDLSGYQFNLKYDPSRFEIVERKEGSLLGSDGTRAYALSPAMSTGLLKNVAGVRLVANGSNGAGVLYSLTLRNLSGTAENLETAAQLENVKLSDSKSRSIPYTILPTQIQNDATTTISLPTLEGEKSGQITVPVKIAGAENVFSGTITFTHNKDVLSNPQAKAGNLLSGFSFVANTTIAGQVTFTFAGATPLHGDGILAEVSFNVIGSIGASTDLKLTSVSLNDGAVSVDLINGKFTVVSASSSVRVSIPKLQGEKGKKVTVPLNIERAKEIFSGTVGFTYTPSVLANPVANAGDLLNGFAFQPNTSVSGQVNFAFAGANSFSNDGVLAKITFDVVGKSGDSTLLDLTSAVFNDSIAATLQDGKFIVVEPTAVKETRAPLTFRLHQNYPNPFNPSTTISYEIPVATKVTLKMYNTLGQEIRLLVDKFQPVGVYHVRWDGLDQLGQAAPAGIYIYEMRSGDFVQRRKLILLK